MRYQQFAELCEKSDVEAVFCSEHHWKAVGAVEVNFWPSKNKILAKGDPGKAHHGTAQEAIDLSLNLADEKPKGGRSVVANALRDIAAALKRIADEMGRTA